MNNEEHKQRHYKLIEKYGQWEGELINTYNGTQAFKTAKGYSVVVKPGCPTCYYKPDSTTGKHILIEIEEAEEMPTIDEMFEQIEKLNKEMK